MPERVVERDGGLHILLVEDNPGDARYIQELFQEVEELAERATAGAKAGVAEDAGEGAPTIVHETRLEGGLERLEEDDPDVVLLDLNLPDSAGLETVEAVRERSEAVPIVVLTGLQERGAGMDALRRGAEEYLVKDEINADLLVRSVYHAIERKANERELERQRNQLATLNALNELVHDISHLAFESSTREEIERLVCEQLAGSGPYSFAWIGEVDRDHETVSMRVEAGVEGYLEGITIRADDSDEAQGPTGRAIRNGEVEVARNLPENPDYEPWREHATEHGARSSAAIPIEYEESLYGVLNVYSERPDAFDEDERAVIGRLGQVVAHAINAIERKQALMSEEVVEIRFQVENILEGLDVDDPAEGTITFERAIPVADDAFLEFGTVTEDAIETLSALVENFPHFESVTLLDEEGERRRFEVRLSEPPAISTIATYGGRVESAVVADGDYRMVVHVPPSADVGRVVDAVQSDYPDAAVVAQRHTTRTDRSAARMESVLLEELTEKQRATLESAYYAGFFEWPRTSSGEDVAESMDVSPSTFHQHVRMAERKLLRALLDGEPGAD